MLACDVATPSWAARGGGPIPVETVPTRPGRGHDREAWLAVVLAHLASTLWLFGGTLFGGRLLYFRDLSAYYAPQYVFAAGSLREGLWPLWNPLANAGEPFLLVYPVDLLLLLVGGWSAPLGPGAALHLLIALVGASLLGARLGLGPVPAWLVGTAYGLGGFCLSTVNLLPLFQAVAWAPMVVWALLGAATIPSGRRLAMLAVVLTLQVSTLAVEIVLQTVVVGVVLAAERSLRSDWRRLARLVAAGVLALLLAAPAVLGVRSLVSGTERERGFGPDEVLSFSLHPVALVEMVLPKMLGEPHAFSDRDYWGRAYSPTGFPYLVTLYLGLPVLLLAAQSRRGGRLWGLACVGILLALGRHGPLGLFPADAVLPFRGPQKLLFLTHVALALLAGFGLERAVHRTASRPRLGHVLVLPGVTLVALALGLHLWPGAVRSALGHLAPPLLDPRGLVAATELWPKPWLASGALALAAGLVLGRGRRMAWAAAGLAALDLLIVNGATNPLTQASFYDLRPDVAELVRPAASEGRFRWFSYGVANTPGLRFEPVMSRARSDVWLYYLDRQSLLPRTPTLDGLEGAYDIDRTGWAPAGATLPVMEASPEHFRDHHERLRLANVRWVLSFRPLPEDLVERRGEVSLPEIESPLSLYELRRPLPRAFWVPEADTVGPEPGGPEVEYERLDAHTVKVRASTPPGVIVVLDGHHPDWAAEDRSGPVPLHRGLGRYQLVPTPGGPRELTLRYRPRWPPLAFGLAALGLVALLVLARK
jgi:hypothetical protein